MQQHTVKIVVLVPPADVVLAVHLIQNAVVIEHRNLERRPDSRRGGGRLEKHGCHARGLEHLLVDGIGTLHKFIRVHLAVPRSGTHAVLEIKIRLISDLERVQTRVVQVVHDCLGMLGNAFQVVGAFVGEIEAVGDKGVFGESVEGAEVVGADDHGVCGDDALGGGIWVLLPAKVLVVGVVDHVVLGVPAQSDMGRRAGIVGQVLQQLYGKLVGVVPAGEGEEVGGLDAEASEGRVEIVGDLGVGATRGGRQRQ